MLDTTEFVPDPPFGAATFASARSARVSSWPTCIWRATNRPAFRWWRSRRARQPTPKTVADRWGIPKVHASPKALIEDAEVEIVDIAFPPDQQPELIRHALQQKHVKAILAQKPLALDFVTAKALAAEAKAAGKILSVNQNMRFDQSMRVLKQILDRDLLGTLVLATIEMRAIPHWQPFLADYDRLTLLNMSIHHLDVLRFLLGDPTEVMTMVRQDPRTSFAHRDGICVSTLKFPSGVMAVSMEDVWTGPREENFQSDIYIKWRIEGTDGSPTVPSAGRTIRPAARARCATAAEPPEASG